MGAGCDTVEQTCKLQPRSHRNASSRSLKRNAKQFQ